jgi:hypothetical protein
MLYISTFEEIEAETEGPTESSWHDCSALMTLAFVIADSCEDPEYLTRVYKRVYNYVRYSPLLSLALRFQLKLCLQESSQLTQVAKRAIRRIEGNIEKRMREDKGFYTPYLPSSKT